KEGVALAIELAKCSDQLFDPIVGQRPRVRQSHVELVGLPDHLEVGTADKPNGAAGKPLACQNTAPFLFHRLKMAFQVVRVGGAADHTAKRSDEIVTHVRGQKPQCREYTR